jgi:hypothetical protein
MTKHKRGKNNPATGQQHQEGDEKSTNRHVYVEPGVQIDLVEDLKETFKSGQTESTTQNSKQLFWTKVSAALFLLYVALTLIQACLTQKSISEARQHFAMDQRPYVWDSDFELSEIATLKPLSARIWYANFGKSPALQQRNVQKLFSALSPSY